LRLNLREIFPVRQCARTSIRRARARGRPTTRGTTHRRAFLGGGAAVVVGALVVGGTVVVGWVVVPDDVVDVPVVAVLVVPEGPTVNVARMMLACGSH
jgi:hypothetical protein